MKLTSKCLGLCLAAWVWAFPVSLSDFLATASADPELEHQGQKINYLEESTSSLSLLDEVELRYRNEGLTRSRYSLRLSPRGVGETRAGKKVYASTRAYNNEKKSMLLNKALRKRYMLAAEYLYRRAMHGYGKELEVLHQDRINVLRGMSTQADFDFNRMIEAGEELTEARLKTIELETELEELEREIKNHLPPGASIDFDTTSMITMQTVKETVKEEGFRLDTNNVYLNTQKLELELSKSRYDLENAEARKYLSFIEMSYDHGEWRDQVEDRDAGRDYDLDRSVILQFGLELPFLTPDRLTLNRRKLSYLSDKGKYRELKVELEREIQWRVYEIKKFLTQYDWLEDRATALSSEASLKTYLQVEGVDPLVLLSARESMLHGLKDSEGVKFEIYLSYIKLMDATGRLSRRPLVNILSKNREPIDREVNSESMGGE